MLATIDVSPVPPFPTPTVLNDKIPDANDKPVFNVIACIVSAVAPEPSNLLATIVVREVPPLFTGIVPNDKAPDANDNGVEIVIACIVLAVAPEPSKLLATMDVSDVPPLETPNVPEILFNARFVIRSLITLDVFLT